jgi:hypothetical protein
MAATAVVNTVKSRRTKQPRFFFIIETYESRHCSGPETVASAVVNTVVEVEMQQPGLLIIKAFESRLCSGPEGVVAAAVVNTVVEVEDPAAQIINQRSI